jgi:hypothetical protein
LLMSATSPWIYFCWERALSSALRFTGVQIEI